MKLKGVKLLNLQSHDKNSFKFSPFLNTIVGTTDSGKSSLLRGIIQLITNKMKWDDLRRWDSVSTNIIVSGTCGQVVKRIKSNKKNKYVVNGKELDTVRTDVPNDVLSVLNLTKINIQEQKESWFLIDKGAGVISKEINKVAGLSIMDDTIQAVNSEIRDIKARIRSDKNHITECDVSLFDIEWIDKADVELKVLEDLERKISEVEAQETFLQNALDSISQERKKLSGLISPQIIEEIKELFREYDEIDKIEDQIVELEYELGDLSSYRMKLKTIKIIDVSELEVLNKEVIELDDRIEDLEELLADLQFYVKEKKNCEYSLEITNEKLGRIKKCPTCGSPFNHQEIE